MVIGNYWECLLQTGTESLPLQRIVGETVTLASEHFPTWQLESGGKDLGPAEFRCMGTPQGDLRAIAHLIKIAGPAGFYLHSAFPWLAVGAPSRLTVYGIDSDLFALEGFIRAGIDGRPVTFFDPLFALNKTRYRVGSKFDFMLAAVSLNTRRALPPESEPAMTADPAAADHYRFRGRVHAARTVTFLDRPFEVFRTGMSAAGADCLYVDVYVSHSRLDAGDMPVSGTTVTGTLWLHGSLAG